jgi:hypothetical protein
MKLAVRVDAWVCELADDQKPQWLGVDCDAIGAGVFSRLAELRAQHPELWGRCRLVKFQWGASARDPKRFTYQIDECHWALRTAIDPSKPRSERLALPPGNRIAAQLNLRKYSEDIRERIKVETKEQLKNRRALSPDVGDSIVGCMAKPKVTYCRAA